MRTVLGGREVKQGTEPWENVRQPPGAVDSGDPRCQSAEMARTEKAEFTGLDDSLTGVRLDRLVEMNPGEFIADFEVIRKIGEGGMGAVYLCRRTNRDFEHQVAVKLLRGASARTSRELAQERQILARLRHPNIAGLTDGGVLETGRHYVVMEYVEGLAITEFANRKNLDFSHRLMLLLQLCSALEHAHTNLIVHCDIKPENVLVTADHVVKLLDFGIAFLDQHEDGFENESPGFTPQYASPEQVAGQRVNVTSDIYSLGVVTQELLEAVDTLPLLTSRRDFRRIIEVATAEDPADRYASVSGFRRDLEAFRDCNVISVREPGLRYRIASMVRRFPVETSLCGIVVGLIAVASFLLLQKNEQLAQERDVAVTMQARAEQSLNVLTEAITFANPEAADAREVTGANILRSMARSVRDAQDMATGTRAYLNLRLADVYLGLGDPQGAMQLLDAVGHELADPDRVLAMRLLAGVDLNDSRLQGWLEMGMQRSGTPLLWFAVGRALAVGGQPAESLQWLMRAHAEASESVLAHRVTRQIVDAYLLNGDLENALTFLSQYSASDANTAARADALHSAAALQLRSGKAEEAVETAAQAVSMSRDIHGEAHPGTISAQITLASALISDEKIEDGIRELEKAVQTADLVLGRHRQTALAHYQLGRALLTDERDRALQEFASAIQIAGQALGENHPATATFNETLAAELWRDGNLHEAAERYRSALHAYVELGDTYREGWVRLYYGDVLRHAGNGEDAQIQYTASRELANSTDDTLLLVELDEDIRDP